MKLAMIMGSPKRRGSMSAHLIKEMTKATRKAGEVLVFNAAKPERFDEVLSCDRLVFVFPLYFDSLPSHVVSYLEQLAAYIKEHPPEKTPSVYAVCNLGFYEGYQTKWALGRIQCWAEAVSLPWKTGLGIGAGPFTAHLPPEARKRTDNGKEKFLELLFSDTAGDNIYTEPDIPKEMFVEIANANWIPQLEANHLTVDDVMHPKLRHENGK
ncbi:NAD(P)H-dependent oxidoreductase [Methanobacterium formicicum]|jgi:hypothetical protein|uniref:NAD(P)H-dependent oxidoreductase n=1 Tax=Methanobacterium formicicum TaxID=2162 RepID=UPI002491102D|nr:NAD(P)H-dependent oxidoreductase [Methanobacterium formicicum]